MKKFNVKIRKKKDTYQNFNKQYKKQSRVNIRCGGILFTENGNHIVIVQNKYILKERKKILWGLPKGHIKENETYAECARREIYEETGIRININEYHPKLKINNTFYFPIHLKFNYHQLRNIMHINDTIEINKIDLLNLKDNTILTSHLNYELRKFLEMYISRAKRIALEHSHKKEYSDENFIFSSV